MRAHIVHALLIQARREFARSATGCAALRAQGLLDDAGRAHLEAAEAALRAAGVAVDRAETELAAQLRELHADEPPG